jgi:hypothetical protein
MTDAAESTICILGFFTWPWMIAGLYWLVNKIKGNKHIKNRH